MKEIFETFTLDESQLDLRQVELPTKRDKEVFFGMGSQGSPVTGVIDEKLVIIDFGKYEGKSVQEIADLDPGFYQRLATEKENGIFAIRRHRDKTFRLYINPLSNMDH